MGVAFEKALAYLVCNPGRPDFRMADYTDKWLAAGFSLARAKSLLLALLIAQLLHGLK